MTSDGVAASKFESMFAVCSVFACHVGTQASSDDVLKQESGHFAVQILLDQSWVDYSSLVLQVHGSSAVTLCVNYRLPLECDTELSDGAQAEFFSLHVFTVPHALHLIVKAGAGWPCRCMDACTRLHRE